MIKLLYTRARREGYSTAISHLLYERECTCSSYPCWSCWVSEYLLLLKRRVVFRQTTCCFSSNDVLFFIKRRVVFRQTTCCFSSNDVLFFIKRRVVFHQTTCCFSSNDVLFFVKRRVVFRQTTCCFSSNNEWGCPQKCNFEDVISMSKAILCNRKKSFKLSPST